MLEALFPIDELPELKEPTASAFQYSRSSFYLAVAEQPYQLEAISPWFPNCNKGRTSEQMKPAVY